MRIGIITYFNIKNYGSVLQAFALKQTLNQMNHQCIFLNVREEKSLLKLAHKCHVAVVTILKLIVSNNARKVHKEIRMLRRKSDTGFSEQSNDLINKFIFSDLDNVIVDRISIKKQAYSSLYDAFICGSDQIWSPLSVHLSGYKYLDFAPKSKRIAYAPSFGVSVIPNYNKRYVKKQIKCFRCISVRENDGAEIVNELIGKNVPVVLDPTMLLSGSSWRKLYQTNSSIVAKKVSNKYILCYFFEEPGQKEILEIVEYASKNQYAIITFSYSNTELIANGAQNFAAGPFEFLELVDKAEAVFTNSFHGCVFSILFKKKFLVYNRKHSKKVCQTSRIITLLDMLDINDSFYSGTIHFLTEAECVEFDMRIESKRKESLEYLESALNIKECDE